jgi:hypothetical protein
LPYHGEQWNARRWLGETGIDALTERDGARMRARDMGLHFSEGPAITVIGKQPAIENCELRNPLPPTTAFFENLDWSAGPQDALG